MLFIYFFPVKSDLLTLNGKRCCNLIYLYSDGHQVDITPKIINREICKNLGHAVLRVIFAQLQRKCTRKVPGYLGIVIEI